MSGNETGAMTPEELQQQVMETAGAVNAIRTALGLSSNISEYTPQVGRETMAAHAALVNSVHGPYTEEGRINEIYRRISGNLPAGYRAQLDGNPQAKSAFMTIFMNAQLYVDGLDRVHNATAGAPVVASNTTYTADQLRVLRESLVATGAPNVAATLSQQDGAQAVAAIRDNARQIGASLRLAASNMSDSRLGQAILDKMAAERTAYFAANPDATQGQFKAHMRTTYGVGDVDAVSRVATAMNNVQASGAFSVRPATPSTPERRELREITPDGPTMQAMQRIREQIFPALDIRPSGTDNAAFRADFAQMSRKLANLFGIQGDPNSQAVRDQVMTRLDALATHEKIADLRAAAGYGAMAFQGALVAGGQRDLYDKLPQAIKDDPMKLFQLLDNRNELRSSLNAVYASRILEGPQEVVVARTGDEAPVRREEAPQGPGQSGATEGANTAALQQAQALKPAVLAIATALGVPVEEANMAQLSSALNTALAQKRAEFFGSRQGVTADDFAKTIGLMANVPDLVNEAGLQTIVQAAAVLSQDAATRASQSGPSGATPARIGPRDAAEASYIVENVLIRAGAAIANMGGGGGQGGGLLGGLNIAGLAGFTPPETADGNFDAQSQNALHMVLMGLKKVSGDPKADGTYDENVGRMLMKNILSSDSPVFQTLRSELGVTTKLSAQDADSFVADPEAFLAARFPPGQELTEAKRKEKDGYEQMLRLIRSLDKLNEENKLNNERAREVTFMGTVMDRIGQMLPDNFKNFLRNFFENDQFGQFIGGILNMFGFPVQRLWGGQAPGSEAVRGQVRDGYRRELVEAGYDHDELKRRILERMDDSLAFKAAKTLLFAGQDDDVIRREVTEALDAAAAAAAREPDREKAADIAADTFADELVRRGEMYQRMSPAQREDYVRQVREAYERDVRTMPGVPADGLVTGQRDTGQPEVRTAAGVPNYSAEQIAAVSAAMGLVGISVPEGGLTAAGAKIGIDQIHAETTRIAGALGLEVTNSNYDGFGRRVQDRIAEERTKFFGDNPDATEGAFKEHMRTLGVQDLEAANKYAQAFRDIHTSGAMNLGVAPEIPVARTGDAATLPAADGVVVEADGKRFELVFNPNNADFIQGPTRYSYGRVAELQNILSQNSGALGLSTLPAEYMRNNGQAPDMMTRNTCMALEELLVRAQLDKGVALSAVSHKYDDTTIGVVADYMRSKGMNEQDITRFTRTVTELRGDMKSTDPRNKDAGAVQPHSVWAQSYIHNQVEVRASMVPAAPVVEEREAGPEAAAVPADRYPGIKMSPENELPPGMTIEQVFERYKEFNKDKNDPNCAPLVFEHQGRAYAGIVEEATNTFRVIEMEGYLNPEARSYRALSDSDYRLFHDNYNWRNGTPAGIIAYIDKQLCLEPLTVTAERRAEPAEREPESRPQTGMREEFNAQRRGLPQSYWDLPRLSAQHLEGLDKGCLNASELDFLYQRAVGTRLIPEGGALLTPLNAEDKARLGGDMIISVKNRGTGELEHRLVNFNEDKIKIGRLTENYGTDPYVRRLDDFLDTQYDHMAMSISVDDAGTRVTQGYRNDHLHTVEPALRHLYPALRDVGNRDYELKRREYIRGTGNAGEGGFQTRQAERYQEGVLRTTPLQYRGSAAEHPHGPCNGQFNDRAARTDEGYVEGPRQFNRVWGAPLNTFATFGWVLDRKFGGGDDAISQNARDCHVTSPYDHPAAYEAGVGMERDRTPGVVDPPR